MCAQDSVPQPVENGGPNFPPAEAKHGQVLRGCKELSFSHTLGESSVPDVIRLPVPRHLRGVLAAILILIILAAFCKMLIHQREIFLRLWKIHSFL